MAGAQLCHERVACNPARIPDGSRQAARVGLLAGRTPARDGGGGEAADRQADAALLRLRRLRGLLHAQRRADSRAARTVAETTMAALHAADVAHAEWAAELAAFRADEEVPGRVLERAEAAWQGARAGARRRRREEWRRWVQDSLANSQGRLYRWIRSGGSLSAELVPDPATDPGAAQPGARTRSWLLAL